MPFERWDREVVEKFLEEKFSTASEGSLYSFCVVDNECLEENGYKCGSQTYLLDFYITQSNK